MSVGGRETLTVDGRTLKEKRIRLLLLSYTPSVGKISFVTYDTISLPELRRHGQGKVSDNERLFLTLFC